VSYFDLQVHVSTDIWTQRNYRNSYAVVNAHVYIAPLCAPKTLCLGIEKVSDHTALTIYNTMANVLEKFNQKIEDVGMIVTDNVKTNRIAFE
jgi:hypothetical protein